ncbi:MAG TPA: response regulator [Xanthobacteraceae bacterium]|nr:response regulator [Xanthobacteraceae bacterium]
MAFSPACSTSRHMAGATSAPGSSPPVRPQRFDLGQSRPTEVARAAGAAGDQKSAGRLEPSGPLRITGSLAAMAVGGHLVSQSALSSVENLANRRILVAEDEGLIALDLESMLQGFGCEVVGPLSDIHEILDAIRSQPVDGALLDVNLRGRQVFEILPEFISRKIPVVLTSGYDDATLFPRVFRELPRISKPFDLATLRQVCALTMGVGAVAQDA